MISSLSHSIDPSLENSMQDYRAQLNEITKNQADEASASPLSENETQNSTQVVSEKPSSEPQTPDVQEPINYEEIYKDVEERNQAARDDARQAAVHVTELNTKQAAFDTYMDASQNTQESNEGNNDGTYQYDPQKVYETSMDYSKNQALISAFETVANNGMDQHHVSIMV